MAPKMRLWEWSFLIWMVYVAALVSPAANIADPSNPENVVPGFIAFQYGWIKLGFIPELANVALLVGWICLIRKDPQISAGCGILGVCLGLTAPVTYGIGLAEMRVGYFLWLISNVLLILAAVFQIFTVSTTGESKESASKH